jgi:hypothetical protein
LKNVEIIFDYRIEMQIENVEIFDNRVEMQIENVDIG